MHICMYMNVHISVCAENTKSEEKSHEVGGRDIKGGREEGGKIHTLGKQRGGPTRGRRGARWGEVQGQVDSGRGWVTTMYNDIYVER